MLLKYWKTECLFAIDVLFIPQCQQVTLEWFSSFLQGNSPNRRYVYVTLKGFIVFRKEE